jgi:hypothetical protein
LLHIHLHLHVSLARRSQKQNLGTFYSKSGKAIG